MFVEFGGPSREKVAEWRRLGADGLDAGSIGVGARTVRYPGQEAEPGGPGVPGVDDRGAGEQVVQRAVLTLDQDAEEAQSAQEDAEREEDRPQHAAPRVEVR